MASHDDLANRDRSRVRHEGDGGDRPAHGRARAPHPLLLQRPVPGQVRRPTCTLLAARDRQGARDAGWHHLHLPHASRDPPGRAGALPDLRHGAGACRGHAREQRSERGTLGHDAAAVDRRAARRPGRGDGHGRAHAGPRPPAAAGHPGLGRAGARHPRGAVGRLAVLRARLAVDRVALAQHVHPDRHRHRHGVALQHDRDGGARPLPARAARRRQVDSGLF